MLPGAGTPQTQVHGDTNMAGDKQPSLAPRGVTRAAPFTAQPPSPPPIHVPPVSSYGKGKLSIVPTFESIDPSQLTHEDLGIITQGKTQMAIDNNRVWLYESRRQAQPILDFLYLGPSSVARDRDFLQKEGITMLLAARDSRLAKARLMSAERVALELGLEVDYIDIRSRQELIQVFPVAVKKINEHLVRRYRSQAVHVAGADVSPTTQGQVPVVPESRMAINSAEFSTGKVLVFCETGNDRSAAVVAAYLLTMFNSDLVKTLQFINLQRFCVNFDDETKHLLRSYEDILSAQRAVNSSKAQADQAVAPTRPSVKRNISDTMAEDEDSPDPDPARDNFRLDRDRYIGRDPFAPFVDGDVPMDYA